MEIKMEKIRRVASKRKLGSSIILAPMVVACVNRRGTSLHKRKISCSTLAAEESYRARPTLAIGRATQG